MKKIRVIVLLTLLAISTPFLGHYRAWALRTPQAGQESQSMQPSSLRITSPKPGEKITQNSVTVQYQQVAPAAASGTPTYELRLDSRDPVQTTDTTYAFGGLTPGAHDLIVQIVDANSSPIQGTRSEVHFFVTQPAPAAGTGPTGGQMAALPDPPLPASTTDLPNGGSSLPLLSVIGFGILVGGVISALRTRPAHK